MKPFEAIGQDKTLAWLKGMVDKGRIPHAMMLVGPSGIGKLRLALSLAQYIICEHKQDWKPCTNCARCLQFQKLQYPDLYFAYPIIKQHPTDVCDDYFNDFREMLLSDNYFDINDWYAKLDDKKQGMIYENESEEILRKLSLKPFYDSYKIMIIWLPEKMNNSCANKLLKILEEPPKMTLFILVTEETEQILPTILSRVQIINVPRLSEEDIQAGLTARNNNLTEQDAKDFAHQANGSFLKACKLQDASGVSEQYLQHFINLMRDAWRVGNQRDYEALQRLKNWSDEMKDNGREWQKGFLQYAQRMIRENYILKFRLPVLNYMNQAEREFSNKFSSFIKAENVEKIMEELDLAENQIAQNAAASYVFFDLALKMILMLK